jgi:hypothetical protein
MKLIKRESPAPPIRDNYRRTVGVREILEAEGAKLTIPAPAREREVAVA